jgi:GNAT superfamily N-acetyltransferase
MTSQDIESLERATLAAVPPREVVALDGWLLGLDEGTVGRAHSAVPTRHERIDAASVDEIVRRYAAHGRPAVFRLPRLPAFDAVRARLLETGYSARQPTLTLVSRCEDVAAMPATARVELAGEPGEGWASVFLGEGFDPVDGACRLGLLRRAHAGVFAGVRVEGRLVAVGFGCVAHGWCGVHGMRTAPRSRGRGYAASILSALGQEAARRGAAPAFLQVEQANAAAQALYRRAGFAAAWCYDYWRRG